VRRIVAALVGLSLLTVSLSGCNPVAVLGKLTSPERIPASELDAIIGPDDSPDGTPFEFDMGTQTVADQALNATDLWNTYGGIPQYCYAAFAISFLSATDDSEKLGTFVSVGRFSYPYDREGLLIVNARTFADAIAAKKYLADATAAGDDCANGYQLTAVGDSGWRVEHVTTSDAGAKLTLPRGVTSLYHDELSADSAVEYRDILIQYKNVVAELSCEVHFDSPFSLTSCDTLAESMAKRLVALG
jgi:hypothetical protein